MPVQTASLVISAEDKASAALGRVGKAFEQLDKAAKATKELDEAGKRIKRMQDALGAVDKVRRAEAAVASAGMAYKLAASRVAEMGKALESAKKAGAAADQIKTLTSALKQEERALRGVETALRRQEGAANAARAALRGFGAPVTSLTAHENALRQSIDGATAAMERQARAAAAQAQRVEALARANKKLASGMSSSSAITVGGRRVAEGMSAAGRIAAGKPTGTMAAGVSAGGKPLVEGLAAIGAGSVLKNTYTQARTNWLDMDEATRRQRVILGLDEGGQKPLNAQALKIGQDTRFTNADVVKSQTRVGSALPAHLKDPKTIAAITEASKNYALAMGTTMDEGSEAILGRMLGRRMDMSSPDAAAASATHAANRLVQFAKSSGADHNDVMGYTKFGAAPSAVGGFSEEFTDALAAQLRRIGYEGSMGGNFVRAAATKLAVPTSKGLGVLASSGINHSDYVAKGKEMSVDNLEAALKLKYGKGLNADQRARIAELMQDEDVVRNREEFVPRVSNIVQETLARKTKKGQVNAVDAERITKSVNEYTSASAGAVDIERLMRDVIAKGITPAMAKYLFGQEHGGRAQALDLKTLDKDVEAFKNTPGDRAQKVGEEINAGAYGAYQRMIGSIETFYMRLGQVNDGPLTKFYDTAGNVVDKISNLPNELLAVGTAASAAAAALLGIKAAASGAAMLGVPGAAAVAGAVPVAGVTAGLLGGAGLAAYATADQMPKVAAEQGASGIDPATGGMLEAPGQFSGPSSPFITEWVKGLFGGSKVAPEDDHEARMGRERLRNERGGSLGSANDKATELKGNLDAIAQTDATPKVDESVFDGAIRKARELKALLESLTGQASSAAAATEGAARTSFSDS